MSFREKAMHFITGKTKEQRVEHRRMNREIKDASFREYDKARLEAAKKYAAEKARYEYQQKLKRLKSPNSGFNILGNTSVNYSPITGYTSPSKSPGPAPRRLPQRRAPRRTKRRYAPPRRYYPPRRARYTPPQNAPNTQPERFDIVGGGSNKFRVI